MHYQTMIQELLEERPRLYERLRRERQLRLTVESYALALKAGHESWKTRLQRTRPESSPPQITSEALELALHELIARLPSESDAEDQTFSLDAAMMIARRPSSAD